MNNTRSALAAIVVIAGISCCGVAFAQTPAPPIATAPAPIASSSKTSEPSATKRVETWTKKQWDAAKKEWAKDNAKWTDCQKQSDSQKLSGRKSWSFIYQCMTS
jgi:hypothetical protein